MSDNTDRIGQLSPLKRALLALQEMQEKLSSLERRQHEPIAIIGLSCRFPGANSPAEFWKLLHYGVDAIQEVPADRWNLESFFDPTPGIPGKMITRWGGFLNKIDQFDAQFFGISPREAARMDPQQRLLLEVTWEALERAEKLPEQLSNSQTGVFIGISNNDYSLNQFTNLEQIDAYAGTGNAFSIAANRLSYTFDLRGPSIAIDTACSSSLVTIHLAVQSLRRGESNLAIAGGVNLILSPEVTITFSQAHMMSADGRCKTFDASADGYVRGEGCGIVVLKRLSDAQRDGDNILAVIYGSAVNQDGRSNGLTAPNGLAQQEVIRSALADAGVLPEQIDYIEAHGTGTILGDPIEMRALNAVMQNRSISDPCLVGSVKTNIGHLEAAAGIAGVIKTVLALQYEEIPPHLHLNKINPYIDLEQMPIRIPVSQTPWLQLPQRNRYAGISSFGFGGTNAHLILGDTPTSQEDNSTHSTVYEDLMGPSQTKDEYNRTGMVNSDSETPDRNVLTLSAKSQAALVELAARYVEFLDQITGQTKTLSQYEEQAFLGELCKITNQKRTHLDYRLAIPVENLNDLRAHLSQFGKTDYARKPGDLDTARSVSIGVEKIETADGKSNLYIGLQQTAGVPAIAFLFTGQGSQYPGMSRWLYETQPVYRRVVDECINLLKLHHLAQPLGPSLLDVIFGSLADNSAQNLLNETAYTQPALFVVEYALAQLWLSFGITPNYVMGHSIGEYVAACLAGVFSLENALKLISMRGLLMQGLPHNGSMAVAFAPVEQVQTCLSSIGENVAIAAINGPNNIVISGDKEAVQKAIELLQQQGVTIRDLNVSHAFHSPLMEPILNEFEYYARQIENHAPRITLVSNETGGLMVTAPDAAYWRRHIRQPVQFNASMQTLAALGVKYFLEPGPNPVLLGMGKRCLPDYKATWLGTLKQEEPDWQIILGSLAALYSAGYPIKWSSLRQADEKIHAPISLRQRLAIDLPTYPFQHERHWFATPERWTNRQSTADSVPLVATISDQDQSNPETTSTVNAAPGISSHSPGRTAEMTEKNLSREEILEIPYENRLVALQRQIRRQLAQVLRMEPSRIDLNRPIQYLGLDSIMAIELKNMVERQLQIDLPMTVLLKGPSIVELSNHILDQLEQSAKVAGSEWQPGKEITPDQVIDEFVSGAGEALKNEYGEFPLSYGQRAMWFQHQMDPTSVFNPIYAVRIHSQINFDLFQQTIAILIQRHPSLRTTFTNREGEPWQVVHEFQNQNLQEDDLVLGNVQFFIIEAAGWSAEQIKEALIEDANQLFDLENGPLLRVSLYSLSETESILLMAAHHIVTDLWSLAILINELGLIYGALIKNHQLSSGLLPEISLTYLDYVGWQKKILSESRGESLWEYWKEKLSGDLPVLDLPTDRPRPAVQTFHGDVRSIQLSSTLTEKLRKVSEKFGATLFMVLLAAFKVLLYRYSGQDDIIVGTPTTGRDHAGLSDIVGYFVNPVPLRSLIQPNRSFGEFLNEVGQTVIEALDHQDYPFALLVERIKPDRDPSRLPISQVMFVLQRAHLLNEEGLSQFAVSLDGMRMELAGLEVESLTLETQRSQMDLTLIMAETQGNLGASMTYNTDLFNPETIDRMLGHFETLLESITDDSEQELSRLSFLTAKEQSQVLFGFNQTDEVIWPRAGGIVADSLQALSALDPQSKDAREAGLCVHRIFEAQAARTPNAIAVVFNDGQTDSSLTYRDLNRKANRLAHYLQALGVKPGTIVGVCVERSLDMIIGLLAVLKAGGAYLPMDPVFPTDRLAFMIQDAKISILLSQSHLLEKLPTITSQLIYLDRNWENLVREILNRMGRPLPPGDLGANLKSPVKAGDLAYVIYTSGSTGRSKGVLLQHRGLSNLVWAQIKAFRIDANSRELQFASFSFDASLSEIFTALLGGGRLYLTRREILLSIPELVRFFQDHQISVVTLPPSVLAMMPVQDFPHLKTLVSAGEACTPEIALRWANGRIFLNAYGPTESTIGPTYYEIDGTKASPETLAQLLMQYTNVKDGGSSGSEFATNTVPIGRPISNTRIYLLDKFKQPVPIGMAGEIYVGGYGVARSYLNRPELTAEKFLENPFIRTSDGKIPAGDRLYKTGDLGRYLPDGNIEFLGRVDFQVKLRGFRIELEEIETVLSQHQYVQQAAVVVRGTQNDNKRLVAYVVPDAGVSVSVNELRSYLRKHLPEYMIPSAFVLMDGLPLTSNGKVDRKSLPEINGSRPDLDSAYVPPQSEMERVIANIWQEVLAVEKVGLNDNFFDLGGHSLLLFKAHTRLQETLDRTFSMVELFRFPTVSALAEYLSKDTQDQPGLQKAFERADQQKDAMKRQVDRMREIANTRAAAARQSAMKRVTPKTGDKKSGG